MQQLELAALVCSQAIRKNANYAPIHNTSGLILNELGQVNSAVKEFQPAAQLDPKFFEAQMNLAAINLSFRGFDKAEGAYRKALEMHPNDYDAHLGLALALRGQIDDSNYDKQVAAVQAELDACKKIDAARPDAYFNEGILTQEYKAKGAGGTDKAIAVYQQAKQVFQTFMEKAAGKREYDGAVKKTKERMQDIDDTIDVPPGRRAGAGALPPPPAPPAGSGDASGGCGARGQRRRGPCRDRRRRRQRPAPAFLGRAREPREPWVLRSCQISTRPSPIRDAGVTPKRVDPISLGTYTYTVIPADNSTLERSDGVTS